MRDRVKMDFEGEFRLAPLPRGERAARQLRVYTANSISDYDWNPIPFATETGFGPAAVWPAEFRAAKDIEAGREPEADVRRKSDCEIKARDAADIKPEIKVGPIPIRSAYDALSPKLRKDIFGGMPRLALPEQEAPFVMS